MTKPMQKRSCTCSWCQESYLGTGRTRYCSAVCRNYARREANRLQMRRSRGKRRSEFVDDTDPYVDWDWE